MGRIGVTYEQVCDAIDRLRSKKIKISNSTVRAELGTGSTKTIMDHLRRWREAHPEEEPTEQSTDKIRDYSDINKLIDARVDAEIEEVEQRHNDYVDETEKTINGLRIECERQDAEIREQAARIEQLLQQAGEQAGKIAELQRQLADRTAERDEARADLKTATEKLWSMYERATQRDSADEQQAQDDPRQQNLWGQGGEPEGGSEPEEPQDEPPQGQGRKRRK